MRAIEQESRQQRTLPSELDSTQRSSPKKKSVVVYNSTTGKQTKEICVLESFHALKAD